jgi:hypothetical protein
MTRPGVEETLAPGVDVSDVARRYRLTIQPDRPRVARCSPMSAMQFQLPEGLLGMHTE